MQERYEGDVTLRMALIGSWVNSDTSGQATMPELDVSAE